MEDQPENFHWDWIIVSTGMLIVAASFFVDLFANESCSKLLWFNRSGSLMVLAGAILEYRQHSVTDRDRVNDAFGNFSFFAGAPLSEKRKGFEKIAFVYIIFGTLVWGYGDIPFNT